MEAFLMVVILEGVEINDFTTGGSAMERCLTLGGDGAEKEGPIFRADCSTFTFNPFFNGNFSAFSKLGTGSGNVAVCALIRGGLPGDRGPFA